MAPTKLVAPNTIRSYLVLLIFLSLRFFAHATAWTGSAATYGNTLSRNSALPYPQMVLMQSRDGADCSAPIKKAPRWSLPAMPTCPVQLWNISGVSRLIRPIAPLRNRSEEHTSELQSRENLV